jgi:hypothetical protein
MQATTIMDYRAGRGTLQPAGPSRTDGKRAGDATAGLRLPPPDPQSLQRDLSERTKSEYACRRFAASLPRWCWTAQSNGKAVLRVTGQLPVGPHARGIIAAGPRPHLPRLPLAGEGRLCLGARGRPVSGAR